MKTIILCILLTSVQVLANEDLTNYENIVRELQGVETRTTFERPRSALETVRIHASVGLVSSRLNLDVPKGLRSSVSLSGAEALVGIDLFSPTWLAEGAVRTYNEESYATTKLRMHEFDMRLLNESVFTKNTSFRIGGGMSARYLNFNDSLSAGGETIAKEYTTPATLIFTGVRAHIHNSISLDLEMSYRSSMISETIDDSAIDGSVRVTGSF